MVQSLSSWVTRNFDKLKVDVRTDTAVKEVYERVCADSTNNSTVPNSNSDSNSDRDSNSDSKSTDNSTTTAPKPRYETLNIINIQCSENNYTET